MSRETEDARNHRASFDPLDIQHGGDHYKAAPIQPIVFSEINGLTACEHSVIKYVSRHRRRDGAKDLKKSMHILQIMLKLHYGIHTRVEYDGPLAKNREVGPFQFPEAPKIND